MIPELAKYDFHVSPGDVLLLNGLDEDSVANKNLQSRKRGIDAHYAHIAIVLLPGLIAHAIPPAGVAFSRWCEIEHNYDIDTSHVARHELLATDPDLQTKILSAAEYYYRQPFRLTALRYPNRPVRDQSGIVCSQFVSLVLNKLGIVIADTSPTATLPVDIEYYTRGTRSWRVFALADYGLYSKSKAPPVGHHYHEDLYRAVIPASSESVSLSPEQKASLDGLTSAIASGEPGAIIEAANGILSGLQSSSMDAEQFLENALNFLPQSSQTSYEASRIIQQAGDEVLRIAESISAASYEELIDVGDHSIKMKENSAVGHIDFLAQWKNLYIFYKETLLYLHNERDWEYINRFRKMLLQNIRSAKRNGRTLLDGYVECQQYIDAMTYFGRQGVLTLEFVSNIRVYIDTLLTPDGTFSGIDIGILSNRLGTYVSAIEELQKWAKSHSCKEVKEASRALAIIHEIDIDRLKWTESVKPILEAWKKTLDKSLNL